MNRKLFWKLCSIVVIGSVGIFYLINLLTSYVENKESQLSIENKEILKTWGREAENLYTLGDADVLNLWLERLKKQENTEASIVSYSFEFFAGTGNTQTSYQRQHFGRSIDWNIHLYFKHNPMMEIPFEGEQASFLIQLPNRMRPGAYWKYIEVALQIILPTLLLSLLSYFLYCHIMKPLQQLQMATRRFTKGNFDIRAKALMGKRNDEFDELANTFDQMAMRIGEQIISQRQLIADFSHELRTPLTRLDIALSAVNEEITSPNISRIGRESKHIRKLVDDTLTLAWLENEQPELQEESLELIDLIDVLIEDAKFEYPDRMIYSQLPNSAIIKNTSHRAAGQAIENVLRNALRYTPEKHKVSLELFDLPDAYQIDIVDEGPGVPEELLKRIFMPFFRVEKSRENNGSSFGLGLALAKRQLAAIRGTIGARNSLTVGLVMTITLPKS